MKLLFGCFIAAFLLGINNFSFAQSGYVIDGKVSTDNKASAEGATITLLNVPDSSIVKSTICTQAGHFTITGIKAGTYIILAHKIGYQRVYSGKYNVKGNIYIGDITLQTLNRQLGEVVVTDKRDYIEVKPNKTVLNVDRSILATGSSVYDILSTAPGVRVVDNQVLLKGGQKALVTINGKAVGQLNDDQLAELLKSYQSDMVSQIELIANPPAKYDAAGGGVINIILKKSKNVGFKATLTESAGVGQDYKESTGINLNYRSEKLNLFGNYSFADNKTPRVLDINRVIGTTDLDENYTSTTYLKNNNFNFGADYSITPKQTVGVLMYGYHNDLGIDKGDITYVSNNEVADSNITTKSHINRGITNLNYNVNYQGNFGKSDGTTLSADFDYSTYNRGSSELLQNNFFNADGTQYQPPVFYTDNSPSNITVRSEKIDFSQAISKTGTLSAGLKNNQVNSNNNIVFNSKTDTVGAQYVPVPSLTDHFIYNERINAAYVNYSDKFNKTSLALGLRGEQTNSFSKSFINPDNPIYRNYFNLFPDFELTQNLDKDNQLTINYNRRIVRPNYQDLNPFVAYIDEYSYSTGNTLLKPEYIDTYSVSELYKQKYKFTLSMDKTSGFFVPVFMQNDSSKVYTATTSNIGTRYEYNMEFNLPVTITKWWDINLNTVASYEQYVYNADSARKSTYDIEFQLTQNFAIAKGLKAEVYTSWETPTYYGIKQYNAEFIARAGISQAVLHNNGTLRLAISDIFNSERYKYTSSYENLELTGMEKAGSRFITAAFIYRFGKQTVKSAAKRTGGNMDEQKRLSGGNGN